MKIIPSVDLLDRKVVRLHKGNYNEVTVYHHDAVTQLSMYADAGFTRIHMVDLNGARDGKAYHLDIVKSMTDNSLLKIQFGGGIRTLADLERTFNHGATWAVVTSMAVKFPDLWREATRVFGPEKFICGLDLKDGRVAYSGWTETAETETEAFIQTQLDLGVTSFLCTDISKDGTLSGANAELYSRLTATYPGVEWIASGGFAGKEDIPKLKAAGCSGVIVGKAYFEKRISLEEMFSAHEPN